MFIVTLSNWQRQSEKSYRYGIAQTCFLRSLDMLKLFMRARAEHGFRLTNILREASFICDELKILLRLAKDTRGLSLKHFIQLQKALQEIGKQLGGWIKANMPDTKRPAASAQGDGGM